METSDVIKRKLSTKYDVSVEIIDEIINTPFKIIKREIESVDRKEAKYYNFRILKLGIFFISTDKRTYLRKLMNNEIKGKTGLAGSRYTARKLKKLQSGEANACKEQSKEVCCMQESVND